MDGDKISIPVAEYRALVRDSLRAEFNDTIRGKDERIRELANRVDQLSRENAELRENLDTAKIEWAEAIGLDESNKAKLVEMRFEKGVSNEPAE